MEFPTGLQHWYSWEDRAYACGNVEDFGKSLLNINQTLWSEFGNTEK